MESGASRWATPLGQEVPLRSLTVDAGQVIGLPRSVSVRDYCFGAACFGAAPLDAPVPRAGPFVAGAFLPVQPFRSVFGSSIAKVTTTFLGSWLQSLAAPQNSISSLGSILPSRGFSNVSLASATSPFSMPTKISLGLGLGEIETIFALKNRGSGFSLLSSGSGPGSAASLTFMSK